MIQAKIARRAVTRSGKRYRWASAKEIEHFFTIYKALEPQKWSDVRGFQGVEEAEAEIARSRQRAIDTGYHTPKPAPPLET